MFFITLYFGCKDVIRKRLYKTFIKCLFITLYFSCKDVVRKRFKKQF